MNAQSHEKHNEQVMREPEQFEHPFVSADGTHRRAVHQHHARQHHVTGEARDRTPPQSHERWSLCHVGGGDLDRLQGFQIE